MLSFGFEVILVVLGLVNLSFDFFFLSIVVEKSSKEMERKREKAINELKNE